MRQVAVAVAVIVNAHQQVLVSKRANHQHQGGLWEFPGGKIEAGESLLTALVREVQEELNLYISDAEPLLEVAHDYGDKQVLLQVCWVTQFSGAVQANEGQLWQWADATKLAQLQFPAANVPILAAVLERLR